MTVRVHTIAKWLCTIDLANDLSSARNGNRDRLLRDRVSGMPLLPEPDQALIDYLSIFKVTVMSALLSKELIDLVPDLRESLCAQMS